MLAVSISYCHRYCLSTILSFVNNEFKDLHGNKFSDLSGQAKCKFLDNQLFTYCELVESATDTDVMQTFLNVNFTGRPMSKEHIKYVKEIYSKM